MIETGIGFQNPLFFIGVVENNIDPKLEGKVQVRAFGIHGTNEEITTENLPWSTLIIGNHDVNFVVPPINSWVFGMFLDGRAAQQSFILGLLPTQFTTINDPSQSGWGVAQGNNIDLNYQGNRPQDYGQPALSRLARGEELENTYLLSLETNRIRDIGIAGGGSMNGSVGNVGAASSDNGSDTQSSSGISPGYPEGMSQDKIESIIRQEASLRNINPDVAIQIFRHEGAGGYQSFFPRTGEGSLNGREASFGPFQLYTGRGLGNEYESLTGRSLVTDNTWEGVTTQIKFALNMAVKQSWEPWKGRIPAGIGQWEGLTGSKSVDNLGDNVSMPVMTANPTETAPSQPTSQYVQTAWEEPSNGYNAIYPYNRVIETAGGHVVELDDTPGAERIMLFHKNGSYIQMTPSTTTIKSENDSYFINNKNYHMYVGGTNLVTIEGDSHVLIKGNYTQEIMGNYKQIIHGNHEVGVAGQANINGGEQLQMRGGNLILESNVENFNIKTKKAIRFESDEAIHFKSKNIFAQGTEDIHFNGKNMFVTVSTDMSIDSNKTNIKGSDINIGGGNKVSLNSSTVALDNNVFAEMGLSNSINIIKAKESESAVSVTKSAPPAKQIKVSAT